MKPKAATTLAMSAPRPNCCPAPITAAAAALAEALGVELVVPLVEEDVPEAVEEGADVAEEEAELVEAVMVVLVESIVPQVELISVPQAVIPVKSLGCNRTQVSYAAVHS